MSESLQKTEWRFMLLKLRRRLLVLGSVALLFMISCTKNEVTASMPKDFNSLSTDDKMAYLMESMAPDSLAAFLCEAAMGKVHNVRIELPQARVYVYDHYNEDQIVEFESEIALYEKSLPLHDKVKFSKLTATEDPERYSYELGLGYVGYIRENKKSPQEVDDELAKLKSECRYDTAFYTRFMKGFKLALEYDRFHDLDEKIYQQFIIYPDSIQ